MLEFLHVRKWEKRNRTCSYWVKLLMRISSIETFCRTKTWYSWKIFMNILSFWHRILYMKAWYSSKIFLSDFIGTKCPKIYISKYLLQLRAENYTWRPVIVQNVLISYILLISLDQDLLVNNIYIRSIRTFLYRSL